VGSRLEARVKVLVSDPLDPTAIETLRSAGHEVLERTGLQGRDLVEALSGCAGIIVRGATKVTAEVLRGADSLRVVVRAGSGLDNIDLAVARERGIHVSNTPAANAVSVAELVFALLLALERHLIPAGADLVAGRWDRERHEGREVAGRVMGLLGFGQIGREVATRARAFGMSLIACDPPLATWPAGYEWVRRVDLNTLLEESQVLSLHVPLTAGTRGMIGAAELALLRPDAILVNCARGGVVDETALLGALQNRELRGAALDVFEREPPGKHPLFELPNVIATPHLGATTVEAQRRAALDAARIMVAALATAPG
jgi:D-3-phosphoglycerate dehydrogenase